MGFGGILNRLGNAGLAFPKLMFGKVDKQGLKDNAILAALAGGGYAAMSGGGLGGLGGSTAATAMPPAVAQSPGAVAAAQAGPAAASALPPWLRYARMGGMMNNFRGAVGQRPGMPQQPPMPGGMMGNFIGAVGGMRGEGGPYSRGPIGSGPFDFIRY